MIDKEIFSDLLAESAEKETPLGLAKGFARDAVRAIPNAALGLVQDVGGLLDAATEQVGVDLFTEDELRYKPFEYETIAGGVGGGILGFAAPFTGALKLTKVGKLGKVFKATETGAEALAKSAGLTGVAAAAVGAAGRYPRVVAAGAATDFLTTRQWEPNLSAIAQDYGVNNAMVRFLAADEDTPWLEKRLKGALEGIVIGSVADTFVQSLKVFKHSVINGRPVEAAFADDATKRFWQKAKLQDAPERQRVRDELRPLVGNDVADATIALTDARALTWGKKAGQSADQWYTRVKVQDGKLFEPSAGSVAQPGAESASALRGAVQFSDDGKALVSIFRSADASTAPHEMAHIFRRDLAEAEPELAAKLASWRDKPVDQWKVEDEEAFATSFERYLRDGVAPTPSLKTTFNRFRTWLTDVYDSLIGTPLEKELDDNIREVFDKMLGGRGPRVPRMSPVDPKSVGRLTAAVLEDVQQAVRGGESEEDAIAESMRLHINFDRLDVSTDTAGLLRTVEEITQAVIDTRTGGVQSLDTVKELADELGTDAKALVGGMADLQGAVKNVGVKMVAYRQLRNALAAELHKFANNTVRGATPDQMEQISRRAQLLLAVDETIGVIQKEVARGTGSGRVVADDGGINVSSTLDALKNAMAGGDSRIPPQKILAAIQAAKGDGAATTRIFRWFNQAEDTGLRRAVEMHNEFWMASLLSGVRTQTTNLVGNLMNTLLLPGERIVGGMAGGDLATIKSGTRLYGNLLHYALDTFRGGDMMEAVKTALKTERPVLDTGTVGKAESVGAIPGVLGKIVRLPYRMMGTTDEFFKQLNYRAVVRDQAYRAADSAGIVDGRELETYVESFLERSFDEYGAAAVDASGNFMRREAMQYARESTFTQELLKGTLGRTIQDAVIHHPMLRLAMPFVRTPTNFIRKVVRLTPPLAVLQKEWRSKMISPDPMIRAHARGELFLGSMFWIAATGMAYTGRLTGGGPSDPQERQALMATGWRPYSVVFTNEDGTKEYIEYRRLDPFASILGMAADFAEIGAYLEDDELGTIASAMTMAVARNFTNKTYLTSLSEIVNVLASPDHKAKRFVQGRIAGYVPNILGTFNDDPYLREADALMDEARRKIPGLSASLMPRRNLFGEPITPNAGFLPFGAAGTRVARAVSPAAYSKRVGDPVKEEIAALDYGFTLPPNAWRGVPLDAFRNQKGQTAFDRWQELHGEVEIGGRSLPEAMSRVIKSERYQRLPYPSQRGDPTNPRVQALQDVLVGYREKALGQLLKEFPEIKDAHKSLVREKRNSNRSDLLQRLQQ